MERDLFEEYEGLKWKIAQGIERMGPKVSENIRKQRRVGIIKRFLISLVGTFVLCLMFKLAISNIGLWFSFMDTLFPYVCFIASGIALYLYEKSRIEEQSRKILSLGIFEELKKNPRLVRFTSHVDGDKFPFKGTEIYLSGREIVTAPLTWSLPSLKVSDVLDNVFVTLSYNSAHVIFRPDSFFCRFYGDLPSELLKSDFGECFSNTLAQAGGFYDALKEQISKIRTEKAWAEVVIDDSIKRQILAKVELFCQSDPRAPRGILLAGPPGTGKSLIAKCIAESAEANFISLSLPDLKAANLGESGQRVREVWTKARGHTRSILFIDECEGAFGIRGSLSSDKVSAEIVESFLAEWDGLQKTNNVLVIGATNRKDLIDPAILSRFGAPIIIDTPSEEARKKIIKIEADRMELTDLNPEDLLELTSGMSGRDLRGLIQDIATTQLSGLPLKQAVEESIERFRGKGSTKGSKKITLNDVVLTDETRTEIRLAIDTFKSMEKVQKLGFEVTKTMLLYGPPGTGKTEIARAIANEGGLSFLAATTSELKAGYIGQSAHLVRELFEKASGMSPCILCLDEMEIAVPSRNSGANNRDQFTDEIIGEILQQIDGIKSSRGVFVLGITNYPDKIDSAVLSRFARRIEIPLPDVARRREILDRLVSGKSIHGDRETLIIELAEETEGRSGRELRDLVRKAEERALARALKEKDLDNITLQESDFR